MTRLFLLLIVISIFMGFTKDTIKDRNIDMVIEYAQSYKYDLTSEVCTVFYIDKSPTEIKFHLSGKEKNKIIDEYYNLEINKISGLDKIIGNTYIEDECMIMPKLYTILHVKIKNKLQNIQIDEDCDDFFLSNFGKANKIKKFLRFVDNILKSKPEIKNAPRSNILYM